MNIGDKIKIVLDKTNVYNDCVFISEYNIKKVNDTN